MATIPLVVGDDHEMFRECLVVWLRGQPDFKVVASVASAAEVRPLVSDQSPMVLVLDGQMPGCPFLVGQDIGRRFPATRVIYLGHKCCDAQIARAVQARAAGYLLKSDGLETLAAAIRTVAAGGRYYSPQVQSRLAATAAERAAEPAGERPGSRPQLTEREREVLSLLSQGQSIKQVARLLGVSYKTADNQTSRMMGKLGLHCRAELVRYAVREQLIFV